MAATTLFSSPISHHHHQHQYPISIQQFSSAGSNNILLQPVTTRSPLILIRASSSPSPSPSTVDKQEKNDDVQQESSSSSSDSFTQPISSIPLGGCKSCGKAEIERGCNGEGRIQGGIATVPGFGWWPIKAYRPCPGLVATGGRYRRQGQSMDQVAGFGTFPTPSPTTTSASTTSAGETESRIVSYWKVKSDVFDFKSQNAGFFFITLSDWWFLTLRTRNCYSQKKQGSRKFKR